METTPELTIAERLKHQIETSTEGLESLLKELFESHQEELVEAYATIQALEAKLRLETEAKTDTEIRRLADRDQMSVEAWLKREIENAVVFADAPYIRVQPVFYERLKAHALAKGMMPEALMTTTETTQYLLSLLDNLLI